MTGSLEVNPELSIAFNREEHRIIMKLEYFQMFGNQSRGLAEWCWVTRGWVDNENNNQVEIWTYWITYMNGCLIYGVREQSISQGYWKCKSTERWCLYEWKTQECRDGRKQGMRLILIENTGSGLDNIQVWAWNESSRNLGSHVEVTKVGAVTQD